MKKTRDELVKANRRLRSQLEKSRRVNAKIYNQNVILAKALQAMREEK